MNRIETIVSCIDITDNVADIGCDQIEVGVLLAKKGIKSIASDISKNVIETASKKIKKLKLEKFINLRLGNGLNTIENDNVDTIILAGMGGYNIIEILSKSNNKFKKIITIANNNNDILRKKMNELNYKVNYEIIVKENEKYYNLIVFVEGTYNYTEKELLFGINHKNLDLYNEWIKYLYSKYSKIKNLPKDKNNKINKILNCIEVR